MQNRYAGDVGDYGKYGLLRIMSEATGPLPLQLGVVWCLVPCETGNGDGKHTAYLHDPRRYRRCDPELFDSLHCMFGDPGKHRQQTIRSVAAVESSSILPSKTVFYSEPLIFAKSMPVASRLQVRSRWLRAALETTAKADVVFLDPDNGIECRSVGRTSQRAPKYIFWDDIAAFSAPDRNQSLVIYHHTNRRKASTDCMDSSYEQVLELKAEFQDRIPHLSTSAVLYTRGTRRAFFVASTDNHRAALERRIARMLESPWREHFIQVT